ncbi:MAG: hypothetical protein IJ372_04075, partial [Rhodococcus sp.]
AASEVLEGAAGRSAGFGAAVRARTSPGAADPDAAAPACAGRPETVAGAGSAPSPHAWAAAALVVGPVTRPDWPDSAAAGVRRGE